MARNELENLIRFAKMNDMMNWALEEVLNEYETTKMHHKEPKFDLKTLKPFDKVLVRDYSTNKWGADFFLHQERNAIMFIVFLILHGSIASLITKKQSTFLVQKKIVQSIINGGRNSYEKV